MAERKIRAGYYRQYDGKVVYVVSLATDADTSASFPTLSSSQSVSYA